jgi:hypothetical protein
VRFLGSAFFLEYLINYVRKALSPHRKVSIFPLTTVQPHHGREAPFVVFIVQQSELVLVKNAIRVGAHGAEKRNVLEALLRR